MAQRFGLDTVLTSEFKRMFRTYSASRGNWALAPRLLTHLIKKLRQDERGGVLVYTAVLMPILLGSAGIAVDVGNWYSNKRLTQNAADAAAVAAASEIRRTNLSVKIDEAADQGAAANGFDRSAGDVMDIRWPPTSGDSIGNPEAVEIIVYRSAPMFFSSIFMNAGFDISARAVASVGSGSACVYALNPTAASAVKVHGTAQVNLNCGVYSNSNNRLSVVESGSGCLNATKIQTVGEDNGGCLNPTPITHATPFQDPLAGLPEPSFIGCTTTGKTSIGPGESRTLSSGTFCNDITIRGTVHFAPGLYFMHGGAAHINADATVTGTDVIFFFDETSHTNDTFHINGQADVQLAAPADQSDLFAGVLIYQDRDLVGNYTHIFNGGATAALDGIIYVAGAQVQFNGGSTALANHVVIIADTVDFGGNTEVEIINNTPAAANPALISTARLIE